MTEIVTKLRPNPTIGDRVRFNLPELQFESGIITEDWGLNRVIVLLDSGVTPCRTFNPASDIEHEDEDIILI